MWENKTSTEWDVSVSGHKGKNESQMDNASISLLIFSVTMLTSPIYSLGIKKNSCCGEERERKL